MTTRKIKPGRNTTITTDEATLARVIIQNRHVLLEMLRLQLTMLADAIARAQKIERACVERFGPDESPTLRAAENRGDLIHAKDRLMRVISDLGRVGGEAE